MDSNLLDIIDSSKENQKNLLYSCKESPFDAVEDLYNILATAIDKREPFSLVRLGDGEGRILGYPNIFEESVYINQVLTYQFGPGVIEMLRQLHGKDFVDQAMLDLKSLIMSSTNNADVIGIPSWLHFRQETNHDNIIPKAAQALCVNTVASIKTTEQDCFDHFIFKPFHSQGYFHKLLNRQNNIIIVSHTNINSQMESNFNVEGCEHIRIPGHQTFMKDKEFHYPVEFLTIANKIKERAERKIVLVAAGYLGKHYCNVAKEAGGIAIDIGSIFDGWCGVGRTDAVQNEEHRLSKI